MKTLQEAFDTMLFHIRAQGYQRAVNEKGHCQYRADGKKCAVGALIPDDLYTPYLDTGCEGGGFPADMEEVTSVLSAAGWPTDSESNSLYSKTQDLHDNALDPRLGGSPDYFERRMRSLAERHNLTYTAP